MQKMYGSQSVPQLNGMPVSATTTPAIVFKPAAAKTQLVPLDATQAITLLATAPYTTFYTSTTAVTSPPAGTIAHTSLNMKASATQKASLTMGDSQ
jgi:hypothetical protein